MDEGHRSYRTGSLLVASYLLANGLALTRVVPPTAQYAQSTFVFDDPLRRAPRLAVQYREDRALSSFLAARRTLTDLARRVESGDTVDADIVALRGARE
jgi:hypothetical protein